MNNPLCFILFDVVIAEHEWAAGSAAEVFCLESLLDEFDVGGLLVGVEFEVLNYFLYMGMQMYKPFLLNMLKFPLFDILPVLILDEL